MVGLLLITHNRTGNELLSTARTMLGNLPMPCYALAIDRDDDPEQIICGAHATIAELDQGDGLLILTDIYGSTPSNIANRLAVDIEARVVSGVNLPMVIRVLNYSDLNLQMLTEKAVSGGQDGVIRCKKMQEPDQDA
ncbi:PTS fructose transporter subunit IIA [Solemya pervernicosa gill symbiont]|uniref:PTS fructose transporter subunit IIA n=2 Tax=Gammaproteobacteria incertae sedis TaxID=118884 RepID=A0A1T2L750_9GAMM|nr:PTS sugar transporter subunit IIA [Candidatus Reidiella endopervernicosa]OOZ40882.1 PTS fructose transporter subunit IIA [Solemya pervernicosa gill symbiont]QKQ26150.1 PTS sugar transporter subunit IIA [Candidatus Reidiella endopervernicosa]